jgi:3-phenylpropionate/cinnamic acid dioxygenase small subunit
MYSVVTANANRLEVNETGIEAEVTRALMRHAWGFDEADWELLEAAYTEDATVDVEIDDGMAFMPVPNPHVVGRAAVLEGYRDSYAAFAANGERPWHLITDVLVDSHDGDTAEVRSFNLFLKSTPAGVAVFGMSRYHDHMVKVDGEWRIKSRVNRISYASDPGS